MGVGPRLCRAVLQLSIMPEPLVRRAKAEGAPGHANLTDSYVFQPAEKRRARVGATSKYYVKCSRKKLTLEKISYHFFVTYFSFVYKP